MSRAAIDLPEDYDLAFLTGFLKSRAVPGLEEVSEIGVRRAVRGGSSLDVDCPRAVLTLRFLPRKGTTLYRVQIEGSAALRPQQLRGLASPLLGLGPDLAPFQRLAARDPLLRRLVAQRPGLRVPQFIDPFEAAIRAILGQQVSVAGARTLAGRLVAALGEEIPGDTLRTFPQPRSLVEAGPTRLASLGLTGAKSRSLHALADAVDSRRLDWRHLRALPAAEAEAELVALPGIGAWTASYVRMRALGDLDAFPASDLGVLKALGPANGGLSDPRAARERAEAWRPYRALAVLHLWSAPVAAVRREGVGTRRAPQA